MSLDITSFNEFGEVNRVDIADAPVLGMASSNNKKLVANDAWGMKPATAWPGGLFMDRDLFPL